MYNKPKGLFFLGVKWTYVQIKKIKKNKKIKKRYWQIARAVLSYRHKEELKTEREETKMTYTVWTYDDATCDDMMVFEGTLTECVEYVDGDEEFYIVEPNGFTVVE